MLSRRRLECGVMLSVYLNEYGSLPMEDRLPITEAEKEKQHQEAIIIGGSPCHIPC